MEKSFFKILFICGIISSLLYIGADIFAASIYSGYNYTSQQVSELSAIGAPTRYFWIIMSSFWAPLVLVFAFGVLLESRKKRSLRITGILLIIFAIIGYLWLFVAPMNLRGTIKVINNSLTDVLHIVFAVIQVLVMVLFISFGSGNFGRVFRVYSVATIIVMLACGVIVSTQTPAIAAGLPTPWMGLVERVSVYSPILWILVLATILYRKK